MAEITAHRFLDWLAEKDGYARVIHTPPNSRRDREGKDFILVRKGDRFGLYIQIKSFRALSPEVLTRRLERVRKGEKLRRGNPETLETPEKMRSHIFRVLKEVRRTGLYTNDEEFRNNFLKVAEEIKLFRLLETEKDFEKLVEAYAKIESFLNLFEKQIRHAKLYPPVKVFLIVVTTEGADQNEQLEKLKKECPEIIRNGLFEKSP